MRKLREVLRLKSRGRGQREIASSISVAVGTVCGQLKRARDKGVSWEQAERMTDAELNALLYRDGGRYEAATRAVIEYGHVHRELHQHGVTLQLLWSEYQQSVLSRGDGTKPYQYSQFCELYGAWRCRLKPSMRQVHRAGEKAFVDYSGKKLRLTDAATGEVREVELFVMVLGASDYTYAEATLTQRLHDFVASTIRAFEHVEGAPEILVPDQLRSAVKGPDRYEPDINATYLEMAQHYGVAVIPARPRKPKDKAKAEVGVQVVQRWILARLRNGGPNRSARARERARRRLLREEGDTALTTIEETMTKLSELRLTSMALAVRELMQSAPGHQLSFEEKLGIVVDREWTERSNRRLSRRLKDAKLATGMCQPA